MSKFIGYSVVFAMLFAVSCAYGQSSSDSRNESFRAVKLFVNSDFNKFSKSSISLINEFSPTFAWGKNYGNFHEVSVRDLGLMYVSNSRRFSSTLGYSYNVKVSSFNPKSRLNFYVGAGVSAGFDYSRNNNSLSVGKSVQAQTKVDLNFIPRVTYKVNERTFIDLNIPYSVYSSSRRWNSIKNSEVQSPTQKGNQINNRAFPNQFTVSVGVAIKF